MNTFPKTDHLYGDKVIENLHLTGTAFLSYPFRVVFRDVSDSDELKPVRVMVSVSKKKFKRAVDRNRIKRLMRETYRTNKGELEAFANENDLKLHIAFQYIGNEILLFGEVNAKMQKALEKLVKISTEKSKNTDENG